MPSLSCFTVTEKILLGSPRVDVAESGTEWSAVHQSTAKRGVDEYPSLVVV